MRVFTSNLFRQLVATALVVSMSMCCCNLDTLVGGLSGVDAGSLHDELASSLRGGGDSCCSSKSIEAPSTPQHPSSPPINGCECCGMESMLVSNAAGEVSIESDWFWGELPSEHEITVNSPTVVANAALVVVEPPTLLRQHCALIV